VTPERPVADLAQSVRIEVERNAVRLKNGIQLLTGREWAPAEPTESTVIWRSGTINVRRYRSDAPVRYRQPVLAFAGLVSRPYCFDLAPGNSFVQRLMDAGFDAYVLDWGIPTAEDSGLTLENYLQDLLPRAMAAVLLEADAERLNLLGYCMGGNMALSGLAAEPRLPVANLVVMTTAIDFTHLGPITEALREGRVSVESVLDESGNVPANVIETAFKVRRPTSDVVLYANLLQNLWNDEYLVGYQAMSRWVREHVPMAGAAFLQIAEQWVVENGFHEGGLRLGGRPVRLSSIRVPTLAVIAQRDDLVPKDAATPITDVLTGTDVELLMPDTGHTGLVTGRTAAHVTLPHIFEWLAQHSEELT
jgi:polyhydroxyalkanoate synthase subunit PhaC